MLKFTITINLTYLSIPPSRFEEDGSGQTDKLLSCAIRLDPSYTILSAYRAVSVLV